MGPARGGPGLPAARRRIRGGAQPDPPAFTRQFGIDLPGDYADLLRVSDGFDFDGIVIFGLRDRDDAGGFLPGLLDSNERLIHGVASVDTALRFVGETGDLLFAYDTGERQWKAVSRYGWHTVLRFQSFGDLFDAVLATTQ
ncbi:YrhA family protein [Tessaracoccus coleopterorum]|uniref:YrhA family protein n=1 Tax=Tessaracoccus coleopterorum TaxID=2714950 RepID=UPI0038CD519F